MKKPNKRRKYFIDKQLQTKFILYSVLLLVIYSFLFALALFAPFAVPLSLDYSLEEQTRAARMLLSLHQSVWPALGVVTLLLGAASIFISHAVAGPIYRLKKSLAAVAEGNIDFTIKLRKRDELHDLADNVNLVIGDLKSLVRAVQKEQASLDECIARIAAMVENRHIDSVAGRQLTEQLQANREVLAKVLAKYPAT